MSIHRRELSNISPKKRNTIFGRAHRTHPISGHASFLLFLGIKRKLKGTRFAHIQEVKKDVGKVAEAINDHQLKRCFQRWKKTEKIWNKCIDLTGGRVPLKRTDKYTIFNELIPVSFG